VPCYWTPYYNTEPKRIVINDINPGLVNIYRTIRDNVDEFIEIMDRYSSEYLPLNYDSRKEYYFTLRTEHAFGYEKWTSTEEAAALYFLMKTGFNGIWQINKNTNGRFGTPNGLLTETTHVYEENVVRHWHGVLGVAEIHCGDWKVCCDMCDKERTFIFCDPPYRDSFADYDESFNDDKQVELLEYLRNTPETCTTFLCNRDDGTDFFTSRVGEMNIKYISVTYTAGRRKKTDEGFKATKATEVLIYK
jgi:DNA adenine methylase